MLHTGRRSPRTLKQATLLKNHPGNKMAFVTPEKTVHMDIMMAVIHLYAKRARIPRSSIEQLPTMVVQRLVKALFGRPKKDHYHLVLQTTSGN